jgi:hypothetical protein
MRNEGGNVCEICRRLGKNECGYHQFRNQYLSRFSKSALQENQFAQTQSSINRNEAPLALSNHNRTLTPSKLEGNRVNFSYQQSHSPFRTLPLNTPHSQPQSRILFTPPKPVQPICHLPPIPPPPQPSSYCQPLGQLMRVEGGQVLYYPIYPVY